MRYALLRIFIVPIFGLFLSLSAQAQDEIAGTYNAVMLHDETSFYQFAKVTLRTFNNSGTLKISANVRLFFGQQNANEYLTYEFADVPIDLLTRKIVMRSDTADISLQGTLRAGVIEGEWFSTVSGRVGRFKAEKARTPPIPEGAVLVTSLSGYYRGIHKSTNSASGLPERQSVSFVTTQGQAGDDLPIKITGNVRFYFGDFNSNEYIETKFSDVQFNFYNRFLTAKTQDYGLTFKGTMGHDGVFAGVIFSDSLGELGTVELSRFPPAPLGE